MQRTNDLSRLHPLFADHRRGRGLMQAALAGTCGTVFCDSPQSPNLVHMQVGGFALFGGDCQHPGLADLVRRLPPTWIIPESDHWQQALLTPLAGQVKRRQRSRFSAAKLVRQQTAEAPAGYHIAPIGAAQLDIIAQASGRLWSFANVEDFINNGVGFCALLEGTLVAYAVSYAAAPHSIEIEVQTHTDHRRRGLAVCLCSHLLHHCQTRGILPHWDAANEISARLANKLGFVKAEDYLSFRRLRPDELALGMTR